jgi:hypothetical protein
MNIYYLRVLPRDLFNEAKLLKCIGQLALSIHDGFPLKGMTMYHEGDPFDITLLDDGYLAVRNIDFAIGETQLVFKSQYNSKANYPLYCEHDYCEYLVFDEQGKFTQEFITFFNDLV